MRTLLLFSVLTTRIGADEAAPKQYEIRGRFVVAEGNEEFSTVIPTITVLEGKRAEYRSGGSLSTGGNTFNKGISGIPSGISLAATVNELAEGKIRLQLTIEDTEGNIAGDVARTLHWSIKTERHAVLGKAVKTVLQVNDKGAAKRWAELIVREAKE